MPASPTAPYPTPRSTRRAANRRAARRSRLTALAVGAGLAANAGFLAAGSASASTSPSAPFAPGGATVYTETNSASANSVLAYRAEPGGGLSLLGTYATGGTGTGTSPGSQDGVTLGDGGRLLAVVNGGSDSVSVFSVDAAGRLRLLDVTGSGGVDPISVTVNGPWVYALNAGNATTPATIAGSDLAGGPLSHHPVGVQTVGASSTSPEDIRFSPDGRELVVTEKAASVVDVFGVDSLGLAGPAVATTIPGGVGPYGFTFTSARAVAITEAATNALATFSISPQSRLQEISTVGDGQLAPCWVALRSDGREAFVTNAHNGTISAYDVAGDGDLTLVSPAVQASPGIGDTDIAVTGSSLYVSDQPDFDVSTIRPGGTLTPTTTVESGLPAGTFGLAATEPAPPGLPFRR